MVEHGGADHLRPRKLFIVSSERFTMLLAETPRYFFMVARGRKSSES